MHHLVQQNGATLATRESTGVEETKCYFCVLQSGRNRYRSGTAFCLVAMSAYCEAHTSTHTHAHTHTHTHTHTHSGA